MGVPIMARPRQTATAETPTRASRKPVRRSGSAQGGNRAPKPARGRQTAKTTGPTKPNPFDDIARQVIADQEAKDREAGRDDLIPTLAKSADRAKGGNRSRTRQAATKPAKPVRPAMPAKPAKPRQPTKVQANRTGVSFSGRPTTKVETVAARAKKAGLRIRANADVDAIATQLRATPDAVSAWLATRHGAPTTTKAKSATKAPSVDVQHVWEGPVPKDIPELKGASLVVRYEVRPDDGTVWATLHQVLGPDGKVMPDFWRLPLDYRPKRETRGNGRKLVLKDRTTAGLQTWLIKQGLTTPEDTTV
jgi:hypothetical protein